MLAVAQKNILLVSRAECVFWKIRTRWSHTEVGKGARCTQNDSYVSTVCVCTEFGQLKDS